MNPVIPVSWRRLAERAADEPAHLQQRLGVIDGVCTRPSATNLCSVW